MSFASPYTLVGSGVPKSVKVLFSQRAGWLPEEVQTQPTIWPASLMLAAEKFPRAVITPSSHRKAYGFQEASRPVPTICPALLMSLGYVLTVPGRDPRSVMTPSAHRKAWVGSLQVPLIPTIWPASLMAVARLLSSPGSVPRSWIGSVADAVGATTNTPRSKVRLATRTSTATILPDHPAAERPTPHGPPRSRDVAPVRTHLPLVELRRGRYRARPGLRRRAAAAEGKDDSVPRRDQTEGGAGLARGRRNRGPRDR